MTCAGKAGLPGQAEATRLGYSLLSYAASKTHATYVRGDLALEVWESDAAGGLSAKLWARWKLVTISTGHLSFPHPNLALFERQVLACLPHTEELYLDGCPEESR